MKMPQAVNTFLSLPLAGRLWARDDVGGRQGAHYRFVEGGRFGVNLFDSRGNAAGASSGADDDLDYFEDADAVTGDAGATRVDACCAPPHRVGGRVADARRAIPAKVDGCAADARGGLNLDYVFEGDAAAEAGGATRAICGGA